MSNQASELSIEKVKEILESGNFNEFIGKIEGDCFEAKKQKPYMIDSTENNKRFSARVELVGDIAAMSNSNGGYIICGLPTEKEKELQTDRVTEVKMFESASFYTHENIQEVVKAHIHPELQVTVTWHPSNSDSSKGIGSIYIPPQPESKKHFIVTAVEINGIKQTHFVAIPIRQGSEPVWMSAKQLYKEAANKKPNDIKQAHDSLSAQIAELRNAVVTGKGVSTPADDIQRKIKEVLDVH